MSKFSGIPFLGFYRQGMLDVKESLLYFSVTEMPLLLLLSPCQSLLVCLNYFLYISSVSAYLHQLRISASASVYLHQLPYICISFRISASVLYICISFVYLHHFPYICIHFLTLDIGFLQAYPHLLHICC